MGVELLLLLSSEHPRLSNPYSLVISIRAMANPSSLLRSPLVLPHWVSYLSLILPLRFQTDFAAVSEWLLSANKHQKPWSNLADTSDLSQEGVRNNLIKLLVKLPYI